MAKKKSLARAFTQCRLQAYTSKTCGCCGYLHHGLKAKAIFVCPKCGHEALRDNAAARNILICYILEHFSDEEIALLTSLQTRETSFPQGTKKPNLPSGL